MDIKSESIQNNGDIIPYTMVMAPSLSVIIPAFNEEKNLPTLYSELSTVLPSLHLDCEILVIDDASTDGTAAVIAELASTDSHIRGIRLLRNTKKAGALTVGFREAQGKIVITMDADLQDDPAEIPNMLREMDNGADIVTGWKKHRKDSLKKRAQSLCINKLSSLLLGQTFHDMNSGLKAYRRDVLKDLQLSGSNYRFIPHLLCLKGYKVVEIPVNHRPRKFGESKFGFTHRFRGVFDLITLYFLVRFGDRPFHFFGWLGIGLSSIGGLAGLYLAGLWLAGEGIGNRPLLLLSVLLLVVGVQIISIGLIGELFLHGSHHEHAVAYKKLDPMTSVLSFDHSVADLPNLPHTKLMDS